MGEGKIEILSALANIASIGCWCARRNAGLHTNNGIEKVDNPKTKFKIWINPDNPSKSLVVNDLDIHTVLWMGVAVVIFVVLLLREVKNI
jgi:hypothetical protein